MSCKNNNSTQKCNCSLNIKTYGVSNLDRVTIEGGDRTALNWSEISVPEILDIPATKPDIENLDQVYVQAELTSVKLIETPVAYKRYTVYATADQITAVTAITNAIAALDFTAIYTAPVPPSTIPGGLVGALITAINTAIGVIPIPAVDAAIAALNAASVGVANSLSALQTAALDVVTALALGPGVLTTSLLCSLLTNLQTLVAALITSIKALLAAIQALVAVLPQSVLIVLAVQTAITALTDAVNALLTDVQTILADITAFLAGLVTAYIEIISNEEGTCLTGRKLVIEGVLKQKVVYTANVETQSVHSAHYSVPFSAFVIPYANFEGLTYSPDTVVTLPDGTTETKNVFSYYGCTDNFALNPKLCEEFSVNAYIEDIFAYALDERTVFKNVTLFLLAKLAKNC